MDSMGQKDQGFWSGASRITLAPLLVCWAFLGCGSEANFAGESGAPSSDATGQGNPNPPGKEPPGDEPSPLGPPLAALTWFWQCDSDPAAVPKPQKKDDAVVEGIGPHPFNRGSLDGTPITFSGRLCSPVQMPRDILFVLDVSGSMSTNDPLDSGSCGRLAAMQQVMASMGQTDARFSLVTFSSLVDVTSGAYFDSATSLFASVAAGGSIDSIVCKATAGTNYDAALGAAQALLPFGRANATKEIYFISDGQPDSKTVDGVVRATEMKASGVAIGGKTIPLTIATIMLKGADTVLESDIASRDGNGKALHANVTQTGDLAKALTDLTANSIVDGTLSYRAIGQDDFTTLSLLGYLRGFDFTLPSISIDPSQAAQGLEVKYEYTDKQNNRYESGGKLVWKDGATN